MPMPTVPTPALLLPHLPLDRPTPHTPLPVGYLAHLPQPLPHTVTRTHTTTPLGRGYISTVTATHTFVACHTPPGYRTHGLFIHTHFAENSHPHPYPIPVPVPACPVLPMDISHDMPSSQVGHSHGTFCHWEPVPWIGPEHYIAVQFVHTVLPTLCSCCPPIWLTPG